MKLICTKIAFGTISSLLLMLMPDDSLQAQCTGTTASVKYTNCEGGIELKTSENVVLESYEWSNATTTGSGTFSVAPYIITPLTSGSYSVTVTGMENGSTCTSTFASVAVGTPPPVNSFNLNANNTTCGLNNGSVSFPMNAPSGGSGPYTYSWEGPNGFTATTKNIMNVSAGNYTVTVTNAEGCTNTKSESVGGSTSVVAEVSPNGITHVACFGASTGSISLAVSGSNNYNYQWSPVSPGMGNNPRTNLTAGTYSVIVSGSGAQSSCKDTITGIVVDGPPSALTASASVINQPTCASPNSGTATATPSGGYSSSYTYTWSTMPVQTAQEATGLSSGTYTVTVRDAGGCTKTATVTLMNTGGLSFMASPNNANCTGATGTITISQVMNGLPPYMITWSGPSPGSTTTSSMSYTTSSLNNGLYTVTVTGTAGGCSGTATVTVEGTTGITTTITNVVQVSCPGGNNGSAEANPSPGNGTYSYLWNTSPQQNTKIATNLSATTYTVTVTSGNGCTATASTMIGTVTALAREIVANSSKLTVCPNATDGRITIKVSNGNPGYNINWVGPDGNPYDPSGLEINSSGGSYPIILPGTSGNYNITVTDIKGCTTTIQQSIGLFPALSVTGTATNLSCYNNNSGSISLSVSNNPGPNQTPYTYTWNPSVQGNQQNPSGLAAGTYSVTVKDNNMCTAATSVTITSPAQLMAVISGNVSYCSGPGGSGTIKVDIANALPNQTFTVKYKDNNNNSNTINNYQSGAPITVSPSAAGTYTYTLDEVSVTGNSACQATRSGSATVVVTQSVSVSLNLSSSPSNFEVCEGIPITFTPVAVGQGQNPTYEWYINNVYTSTGSTFTSSSLMNGDSVKCIMTTSITCPANNVYKYTAKRKVTVFPLPKVVTNSFSPVKTTPYCTEETIQLQGKGSAGLAPYTFWFEHPESGWEVSIPNQNAGVNVMASRPNASLQDDGVYTLYITDSRGCVSIPVQNTTVYVNPRPSSPTGSNEAVCWLAAPSNSTYPELQVSNSSQFDGVVWSINPNGPYTLISGFSDKLRYSDYSGNIGGNPSGGGMFSFYAKSVDEGCQSKNPTEVKLTISPLPAAPLPSSQTIRVCETINDTLLKVNSLPQGIMANWYDNSNNLLSQGPVTYQPNSDGIYKVRAENATTGCLSTSLATINFSHWNDPSAGFDLEDIQQDGLIVNLLDNFKDKSVPGSSQIVQWDWDFGSNAIPPSFSTSSATQAASVSVLFTSDGTFPICLTVKDANQCQNKSCNPYKVNNANDCRVQFINNNLIKCVNDSFSLVFVSQASAGANLAIQNWEWVVPSQNVIVTGTLSGSGNLISLPVFRCTAPGTYPFSLKIKDNKSPACEDVANVTITVREKPVVGLDTISAACKDTEINYRLNLSGLPPFTLSYTENNNPKQVVNIFQNFYNIPLTMTDEKIIVITGITDDGNKGCPSTPLITDTIKVLPLPQMEMRMDTCIFNEDSYQITFIPGGSTEPYTINGLPFSGTVFESPLISNGTKYVVNIEDANGCSQSTEIIKTCKCSDQVGIVDEFTGNIATAEDNFCVGEEIVINVSNPSAAVPDPSYRLVYYLYDGNSFTPSNIISSAIADGSGKVVFPYPSGPVQFGVPYYVVGILARLDQNGKPDLAGCNKFTANTARVYFQKLPEFDVITTPVCAGDPTTIRVNISEGVPNFSVEYTVGNVVKTGVTSQYEFTSEPVFTVDTSSNYQYIPVSVIITADGNGCKQSNPVLDTLVVKSLPAVEFDYYPTFCEDDTIQIKVIGGDPDWTYDWLGSLPDGQVVNIYPAVVNAANTFTLRVLDNDPVRTCEFTDMVSVLVKPRPNPLLVAEDSSFCRNVFNSNYIFENINLNNFNPDFDWVLIDAVTNQPVSVPMYNVTKPNSANTIEPDKIYVDWTGVDFGDYFIKLTQSIKLDNNRLCAGSDIINVQILEKSAPGQTEIDLFVVPQIFLFAIDDDVCYKWGRTRKSDLAQFSDNDQFQVYPIGNAFDTLAFYYWVDTWEKTNDVCPDYTTVFDYCATRSYYNPPPLVNGTDEAQLPLPGITLYPNPNAGTFVVLMNHLAEGNARCRLFDYSGRMVAEQEIDIHSDEQMARFQYSGLNPGQYILQILTSDGRVVAKTMLLQR